MKKLPKSFYLEPATKVAPALLGKYLCRNINGHIIKYQITETEAYYGFKDTASHAHKGKTNRNQIMFEEGGYTYIYLCYGIHYLLNIVTGTKDHPEAVLIRGVENYNGPGKLTKYMQIDKFLNEVDLTNNDQIWIEDNKDVAYITSKRVGIDYATDEYKNIHWRFIKK